jgi:hypothetical protein
VEVFIVLKTKNIRILFMPSPLTSFYMFDNRLRWSNDAKGRRVSRVFVVSKCLYAYLKFPGPRIYQLDLCYVKLDPYTLNIHANIFFFFVKLDQIQYQLDLCKPIFLILYLCYFKLDQTYVNLDYSYVELDNQVPHTVWKN